MLARNSSSTGRQGQQIEKLVEDAVRRVIGKVAQEEQDRRNPDARRDRLFERMERFLDGFESAVEEEGPPRGRRGQRDAGEREEEDEEDDGEGFNILELLAGGGRRR